MSNMVNVRELEPRDNHKSFYKKAYILETKSGMIFLKSYNTIVCRIGPNGDFHRYWSGFSNTTMRHIRSFCDEFGIGDGNVYSVWWHKQPVEEIKEIRKCDPMFFTKKFRTA